MAENNVDSELGAPGGKKKAKVVRMSRGDALRREVYDKVLQNQMARSDLNLVFKIQKYNESIKHVESELQKIKDERKKDELKLEALDGDELKAAKAKLKKEDKHIEAEKELKREQKVLLEAIQQVISV